MGYQESRHSNIYESPAARQAELEKKKKGTRGLNIQKWRDRERSSTVKWCQHTQPEGDKENRTKKKEWESRCYNYADQTTY